MAPQDFIPAKPSTWFIKFAQMLVRAKLAISNQLHILEEELHHFQSIPPGCGIVLTSNHADETDPQICMEISRRARKRFITMCNREAFDELMGFAGVVLSRLGVFSVKRGSHDRQSKEYATNVVTQGDDVLVIFPEGEIFYLNDRIQPFHSGAIDICLQAIVENRKKDPNWTAYIVPMAIKYHYSGSIQAELEHRITKMEQELSLKVSNDPLPDRILEVEKALLQREELMHNIPEDVDTPKELTQEIIKAENAILDDVASKHPDYALSKNASTIDKAWQLEAELRKAIREEKDHKKKKDLEQDLAALKEVAQLTSWHPNYYLKDPTPDRLAEVVLKLEREIYRIQRPKQFAARSVKVKIDQPIDMGQHVDDYLQDPHTVRHTLSEQLQEKIQSLINQLRRP